MGLKAAEGGFFVVNRDTGEHMSKKPLPKARALRQLKALKINVPDAKEVSGIPTASMSHGPGGLFSMPGMSGTLVTTAPMGPKHGVMGKKKKVGALFI